MVGTLWDTVQTPPQMVFSGRGGQWRDIQRIASRPLWRLAACVLPLRTAVSEAVFDARYETQSTKAAPWSFALAAADRAHRHQRGGGAEAWESARGVAGASVGR